VIAGLVATMFFAVLTVVFKKDILGAPTFVGVVFLIVFGLGFFLATIYSLRFTYRGFLGYLYTRKIQLRNTCGTKMTPLAN